MFVVIYSFFFPVSYCFFFFFFNDTATTEIYTLSLHDALPISPAEAQPERAVHDRCDHREPPGVERSEEHTSELQSPCNLVCRLLLEKKKKNNYPLMQRQHDKPTLNACLAAAAQRAHISTTSLT